jgi:hypothetical protein
VSTTSRSPSTIGILSDRRCCIAGVRVEVDSPRPQTVSDTVVTANPAVRPEGRPLGKVGGFGRVLADSVRGSSQPYYRGTPLVVKLELAFRREAVTTGRRQHGEKPPLLILGRRQASPGSADDWTQTKRLVRHPRRSAIAVTAAEAGHLAGVDRHCRSNIIEDAAAIDLLGHPCRSHQLRRTFSGPPGRRRRTPRQYRHQHHRRRQPQERHGKYPQRGQTRRHADRTTPLPAARLASCRWLRPSSPSAWRSLRGGSRSACRRPPPPPRRAPPPPSARR